MSGLKFVGELPGMAHASAADARRRELIAHAGEWAEFWKENPRSAHYWAGTQHVNGYRFEAAVRQGKGYVRAVKV